MAERRIGTEIPPHRSLLTRALGRVVRGLYERLDPVGYKMRLDQAQDIGHAQGYARGLAEGTERGKLAGIELGGNTAAHYLNNEIGAMIGFGELIASDPDATPDIREHAQVIMDSGAKAAIRIRQMQRLATIELRRSGTNEPVAVDLDRSISQITDKS